MWTTASVPSQMGYSLESFPPRACFSSFLVASVQFNTLFIIDIIGRSDLWSSQRPASKEHDVFVEDGPSYVALIFQQTQIRLWEVETLIEVRLASVPFMLLLQPCGEVVAYCLPCL